MTPLLLPLDIWSSIGGAFGAMMEPIYWAISGLVVGFHWLFSRFLDPDAGITWTLSIISLTIVIRTLMIPLFVKQINSSRKMQLLGPKLKELQAKYGSDREKLGQETMKMYKEEGVNPAASCLPMLLQMPIFIGLFRVLHGAASNQPRGHFFTSNPELLASLSNAKFLGAEISGTFMPFETFGATQWVALFLIIAMTSSLFFTQLQLMRKNMPPEALTGQMAQQQKMMLYLFPIMYLFFGVSIPIGVMMYWFASNLWTLGQQYILIRNNPTPNTPAFIEWEERMKAKGKDPQEILNMRLGIKKPRETTVSDPTKVARQGASRDTSAPVKKTEAKQNSQKQSSRKQSSQKQTIQRQQPRKKSRAQRKQTRPQSDGDKS